MTAGDKINRKSIFEAPLFSGLAKLDSVLALVLISAVVYLFFIKNYYVLADGRDVSVAQWLWHSWKTDPDSEHGMIVPLISLGLIWWKRESLLALSPKKGFVYICLLLVGSFLYVAGAGGSVSAVGPLALIFWLLGVIGFVGGNKIFLQMLFPVGFLLFMIPWSLIGGDTITVPLRHLMVNIVIPLLNFIGIDVIKVGTAILSAPQPDMGIPAGRLFGLDVDNPCSGIRSLFAITMISALFANLTQPTLLKKWILFLSAFPLAVIGNIFRILMLTIGSYFFGTEFAVGIGDDISFFHMFAGYMVFIIALGFLFFISWLMNLTPEKMRVYRDKFLPKKLSASHHGNSV